MIVIGNVVEKLLGLLIESILKFPCLKINWFNNIKFKLM